MPLPVADFLVHTASFRSIKEGMRGSKTVIFSRIKEEANIDAHKLIVK
jgi:hypothetical protein